MSFNVHHQQVLVLSGATYDSFNQIKSWHLKKPADILNILKNTLRYEDMFILESMHVLSTGITISHFLESGEPGVGPKITRCLVEAAEY